MNNFMFKMKNYFFFNLNKIEKVNVLEECDKYQYYGKWSSSDLIKNEFDICIKSCIQK